MNRFTVIVVVIVALCLLNFATGLPPKKQKPKPSKAAKKPQAATGSANTLGQLAIPTETSYDEILSQHNKPFDSTVKTSTRPTLGFVTPWNSRGYSNAEDYQCKFTYISPVWYQIKPDLTLRGAHDVDQDWIGRVRNVAGKCTTAPKIVPRFLFEDWSPDELTALADNEKSVNTITKLIFDECTKQKYDGATVDFSFIQYGGSNGGVYQLVKSIGSILHSRQMHLILTPAPLYPSYDFFVEKDYSELYPYVDMFMLMTYDYSVRLQHQETGGPSSPLPWVAQSVLALLAPNHRNVLNSKLMIGVNFYGHQFSAATSEAILGNQYLQILEEAKPDIEWNSEYSEHSFAYKKDGVTWTVCYPSLRYIAERLAVAEKLDVGIGIWEIGQGLDYFFELL